MTVVAGSLTARSGFLLGVLWMDLIFDHIMCALGMLAFLVLRLVESAR